MRYSYDYKRKAVELYRQGLWPDTPNGINAENFHGTVRKWVRIEDACGPDALRHNNFNKVWTPEEKLSMVYQVLAGNSIKSIAYGNGIDTGALRQWVRKFKIYGYNGLIDKKKGRKSNNPNMKKIGTRKPPKPNESEYEELVRLRAENEYMKAEIAVIKKEIALREEKEAARLKAKKQRSSKNSGQKDSN